jgi:hypothetical protein
MYIFVRGDYEARTAIPLLPGLTLRAMNQPV